MSNDFNQFTPALEKLAELRSKGLAGFIAVAVAGLLILVLAVIFGSSAYITRTYETVIVTRFGKIEHVRTDPGLAFKIPGMDSSNRVDMRVRPWDGPAAEMPTRDKLYIVVDTFARWQVSDPQVFYTKFLTERRALSRITDILNSETRTEIGANNLVEVVRNTKGRTPVYPDDFIQDERSKFEPIVNGRNAIEKSITERARTKLAEVGVELLEFYLKRVNYSQDVQQNVEERMISERERIASRFRAEGSEEASKIDGRRERELRQIESEAFRKSEEIRGEAEQAAYEVYNKAYAETAQHRKFYSFLKRMDSYEDSLSGSVLFLKMDNPYLSALRGKVESVSIEEEEK